MSADEGAVECGRKVISRTETLMFVFLLYRKSCSVYSILYILDN